jgi:predicted peptidase
MLSDIKQIKRLRYKVFNPAEAETDFSGGKTSRPVLCFLHGNGEHSGLLTIDQALERHGPLKADPETRTAFGGRFIVVFPQLPAPGGNVWIKYAAEIEELVKSVWHDYGGDPGRTYLTGFSYGGNGVFSLAAAQPRLWAALWPVDPTLNPIPKPPQPTWLCLGDYSRGDEASLHKKGFQEIKKAGDNSNQVYIDYGKDHSGTATSAYRDKRGYDWLLKKQLRW